MIKLSNNPKEFWAGLIYIGLGVATVWIGRDYPMGTAGRMGAGYFPFLIGSLLAAVGGIALLRSWLVRGEPIGAVALKGVVCITGGIVLFGLLLRPLGLIGALALLLLAGAAASRRFHLEWRALAGMAAFIAACALVFIIGLGIPMPLLGTLASVTGLGGS